jgi:[ribosomal protein S18]-alanine N-acetyltransferase
MMVDSPIVSINIRPMLENDLERVHEIDGLSFSAPWPPSSYRFELNENPASHSWVAEAHLPDGKTVVVGMVVVWLIVDEAHIATLAVHPEFRGRSIARKLLQNALRECVAWGACMATLEVRERNGAAQALYRDFGFDIVGRRPHYYIDNNEDALIMTLEDMDEEYLEWLDDE